LLNGNANRRNDKAHFENTLRVRAVVVVGAVFIYSMPGYNCTIRERMLYSTCKAPLLEVAEQQIGLEIGRKVRL